MPSGGARACPCLPVSLVTAVGIMTAPYSATLGRQENRLDELCSAETALYEVALGTERLAFDHGLLVFEGDSTMIGAGVCCLTNSTLPTPWPSGKPRSNRTRSGSSRCAAAMPSDRVGAWQRAKPPCSPRVRSSNSASISSSSRIKIDNEPAAKLPRAVHPPVKPPRGHPGMHAASSPPPQSCWHYLDYTSLVGHRRQACLAATSLRQQCRMQRPSCRCRCGRSCSS